MSYIDSHLLENETVIYRCQLHWIAFLAPIGWLIVAVFFYFYQPLIPFYTFIFVLFAIGTGISAVIRYLTSEFGVTNKRVLIKVGFISIHSVETLLTKIESIQVNQSVLGRLFGYGNIVVCGTGGSRDQFQDIDDPLQFRNRVQQQIEQQAQQ